MSNDTNFEVPPTAAAGSDQSQPTGGSGDARLPLRRSDGILGGVATGLADYFGMAPWLIRLAFVILSFFGGLGVLFYLAGWLLIPEQGSNRSIADHWLRELGTGPSWIGAGLIALAAIWLLTSLDIVRSGFAWAIALLILGVLLYRESNPGSRTNRPTDQRQPEPTSDFEGPAAPLVASNAPETTESRSTPPRAPVRTRPVRPPSRLGRYTLAAGLIGVGVLALLDNAGVLYPDARHYLALAVAIVGVGLLVGSLWGRSRLLIVAGLVLVFMMGAATVGTVVDAFADEVETHAPAAFADVAERYTMERGTLILDLTAVDWKGREADIEVELGAGRLEIHLPREVSAGVNARAGVGRVEVLGRSSEGLGVGRSVTVEGPTGSGNIVMDVRVGAGQITVMQESN